MNPFAELRADPVTARQAGQCVALRADDSPLELDRSGLSRRLRQLAADQPRWGKWLRKRPVYVSRITPAYFVGYRNAVLTEEGRPVKESLYLSSAEAAAFHVTRGTVSHAEEPGFVIASAVSRHYFHWTLQCLPSQLLLPDEDVTVVGPPLNSWQRRSVDLAQAAERRFDQVPRGVVRRYPTLTYPSTLAGDGLHEGLRPFFERIREGVVSDVRTIFSCT